MSIRHKGGAAEFEFDAEMMLVVRCLMSHSKAFHLSRRRKKEPFSFVVSNPISERNVSQFGLSSKP